MVGKRLVNTGVEAPFDPLQNFETVTYTGNGGTQKITGYIRKGAAFNGLQNSSASYIDIPSSTTSTTSTVSFWMNTTIKDSNGGNMFDAGGGSSGNAGFSISRTATNGYLAVNFTHGTPGQNQPFVGTTDVCDGTWHHIALSMASDNTFVLYLDGVPHLSGTRIYWTSGDTHNLSNNRLGTNAGSVGASSYGGKIDQVRIFNKALSSGEVTTLYGETYASSTKSNTDIFDDGSGVALYELDEDANSSNFEQAAAFSGSNYITTPTLPDYRSGFAFSCWALSDTTLNKYIITQKGTGDYANFQFRLVNGKVNVTTGNGTSAYYISYTHPTALTDGWHHLVVTGTSSSISIYVDGSFLTTQTGTAFLNSSNMEHIIGVNYYLGAIYNQNAGAFRLDQFRIYSSALSSSDVANLYNETNVPTTNLLAHYKLDGNATDETGNYNATETSITYSAGVYGGTPTNVNFLGMAFQPDFVWMKGRTFVSNHFSYDSVRGATETLYPNLTNAEGTDTNALTSFDSNGFTIGSYIGVNTNNENYVAWCWKAGGSVIPNNNTNGTTTSTVSANTDSGFSIVKYTGSGADATVGHGLSSAPELILLRPLERDSNWFVYNSTIGNTEYLMLNRDLGSASAVNIWNNTSPTSSVFSLTGYIDTNGLDEDIIAYCFHSVDGYQKVGSYSGSGGAGNKQTLGFSPRFIMTKPTNVVGAWAIMDTVRPNSNYLLPNTSDAETTADFINFESDGFSFKNSTANGLGNTYIYLAIA